MDFDNLVNVPLMRIFGDELVTIIPAHSSLQNHPSETVRAVYSEKPIDVEMTDGSIMSSAIKTLEIRKAEITRTLSPKDIVLFRGARWRIDDIDENGFGMLQLSIKELR